MTHCNPAPPNPDGVVNAICWTPELLGAMMLVITLIVLVWYLQSRSKLRRLEADQ